MASTTFVDNSSIIYASWLNDINATTYNGTFISSTITPSNLVCNGSVSGTGFTGLVNNTLSAPGQIGNGTPNTGAFTTLSLNNALSATYGGTGLTSPGTSGNILTSNGSAWTSAAPTGFGVGQTWQDVTSSRASNTTYTNSTGKPIVAMVYLTTTYPNSSSATFTVGSFTSTQFGVFSGPNGFTVGGSYQMIIPSGSTYKIVYSTSNQFFWYELR
jgi:hypothetical protein